MVQAEERREDSEREKTLLGGVHSVGAEATEENPSSI